MEQQALVLKDAQSLAPTDPIGLIQQALSSGTSPEVIRELVPIQQMRFDELSDAQEMIQAAAVLQQKGVGV